MACSAVAHRLVIARISEAKILRLQNKTWPHVGRLILSSVCIYSSRQNKPSCELPSQFVIGQGLCRGLCLNQFWVGSIAPPSQSGSSQNNAISKLASSPLVSQKNSMPRRASAAASRLLTHTVAAFFVRSKSNNTNRDHGRPRRGGGRALKRSASHALLQTQKHTC